MTNKEKQKLLDLNDKQILFCEAYLTNMCNATQAYLTVYKPKNVKIAEANSSRLLSQDKVQDYLDYLKQPKIIQFEITRESQLKELEEIKKMAKVQDGEGRQQLPVVLKAMEIQNKMLGLDAPTKLELAGKDGGAVQVEHSVKTIFLP